MAELLPARKGNKIPQPPDYTLMWRAPDGMLYDWNDETRPSNCVMFFYKIKEDKDAKRS